MSIRDAQIEIDRQCQNSTELDGLRKANEIKNALVGELYKERDELLAINAALLAALELLNELSGEAVALLNAELGLDVPSDVTTPLECARDSARAAIAKAKQ